MRLYASVITLTAQEPAFIPASGGGQYAHAAFFNILDQVDPRLAAAVHEIAGKGRRKPFTVSPLMGLPRPRGEGHLLPAGWACWLRVTLLDDVLFRSFIEYFQAGPAGCAIRLGDAHFLVNEVLTTPGSHPWAGVITLDDLRRRLDAPPPAAIALEFHTPTSFKLGNYIEALPLPRLVFGSLATVWANLSGENLVTAVERFAERHLHMEIHRLVRHGPRLNNQPQIGATGRVVYRFLTPEDGPLARAINVLADLAFYAGIGRKTTQGMGMARRLELDE